ncbi:ATP-binding cassette domain-containing protein [Kineococcus rhizosphaerae]|uniref:ABC-2 type transport system ATP-binding protein n=1 Tax=Kineococcus rhizosphaerae TaxID=559628 RepID=A0A2T0R5U9_9ACTN|nr:ATP-binding cassette domain-containing protein [Kineococcus rhizosphaerae]PRY16095.1 ABC-2 type transport system ATP-binding protein [Kineococcus rhizosphaerae]
MSHAEPAVVVRGLSKSFGTHRVLDGVDLDVDPGTVLALLGPNGAGKTTLVNVLATLVEPDAGQVRVAGHDVRRDPARVRAAIGLTGQFAAVDDLLTGAENLRLMARLQHLPKEQVASRTAELLERFDLTAVGGRRPSTYSGGMRRRLDLAMGLVGRPSVVVLDEPTTGLDPRSRREVWDLARELVDEGATLVLTTQYLEEADRLADRVTLLDSGRVVAEGTPSQLKARVPGGRITLGFADRPALDRAQDLLPGFVVDPDALSGDVPGDGRAVRDVLQRLDAAGVAVERIATREPDLDDVFLALTGRSHHAEEVRS